MHLFNRFMALTGFVSLLGGLAGVVVAREFASHAIASLASLVDVAIHVVPFSF